VVQLHREIDSITNAGADVFVIGNGSPSFIEGFREQTKYEGVIYTDPSLAVFTAAQLERGVLKTLNPLALGKTLGAFARGHRQGLNQGDPWQQGGVLVIAAGGEVKWHHASERPGDNAEPSQIVAALKSA
jgi:hypothetical protein